MLRSCLNRKGAGTCWFRRLPVLFEETNRQGVTVAVPFGCANGTDDGENDPENKQNRSGDNADEYKNEQAGNDGVNGIADLKIERFLAVHIYVAGLVLLHKPDGKRAKDVAKRNDDSAESEQMAEHTVRFFFFMQPERLIHCIVPPF